MQIIFAGCFGSLSSFKFFLKKELCLSLCKGHASAAHFITGHEQTQINQVCNFLFFRVCALLQKYLTIKIIYIYLDLPATKSRPRRLPRHFLLNISRHLQKTVNVLVYLSDIFTSTLFHFSKFVAVAPRSPR